MDFNASESQQAISAQNLYPQRGRKGKKFAGKPSTMVLWRQKMKGVTMRWLIQRAAMGPLPERGEMLARLDGRKMGEDLRTWDGDKHVSVVRKVHMASHGEPLLSYTNRQHRLDTCGIPLTTLARVSSGDELAHIMLMDADAAWSIYSDYLEHKNRGLI